MRIHRQRRPTRSRTAFCCPNIHKAAPSHVSNQGRAGAALPEPAGIQSRIDYRYSKDARGIRRPTGVELDSELTFDTRLPCISADLVPAGQPGTATFGAHFACDTSEGSFCPSDKFRCRLPGFRFSRAHESISCRANLYHCPCSWRAVSEKSASLCQHLAELPCLHLPR